MEFVKFIALSTLFFLNSCGCKNYTIASVKKPIITHRGKHFFRLCNNAKIAVGLAVLEKDFVGEYKLPNDSIAIGYTAGINYDTHIDSLLIVGKGSEFRVGKCKFRVLEVDPYYHFDSLTNDVWGESITLQTISYPKFCPCQNAQLRRYEKKNQ